MIADHFPVVEYDIRPQLNYDHAAARYVAHSWESKQSVDLRWVASAEPWLDGGDFTQIYLCASGITGGLIIRCPYSDFMRDLWRAKGL